LTCLIFTTCSRYSSSFSCRYVIVYLAIGAGGGVKGVEVSSEEQDKTIAKMLSKESSFLI